MVSLFVMLSIPLLILWRACVFVQMWAWFISPAFGLPQLTYPVAIGISGIFGMLTYQQKQKSTEDLSSMYVTAMLVPALTLLIGYIAKQFM